MPHLPSYYRLSVEHQNFVLAYIHNGFDAERACRSLAPADDDKTIRNRATKWIKREDIQEAIADKTSAMQTKQAITRETMIERMEALVKRAYNLPEGDPNKNERFGIQIEVKMIQETNKILGYHVSHHVHTNADTVISFLDVGPDGLPLVAGESRQLPEATEEPLDNSIPSEHAIPYSAHEILDPENGLSMEDEQDDQEQEDEDQDPDQDPQFRPD